MSWVVWVVRMMVCFEFLGVHGSSHFRKVKFVSPGYKWGPSLSVGGWSHKNRKFLQVLLGGGSWVVRMTVSLTTHAALIVNNGVSLRVK
mmetsp:Transcript_74312/g.108964  ORF Transcript_74312/g.108964 Transcript_74312/m.108964 type:complete len:89 (-) Transcript_74312:735-1001(-)